MARRPSWSSLRKKAEGCRRCDSWQRCTQTLFGERQAQDRRATGDSASRRAARDAFVKDLETVARKLGRM
jgi:hypothetical protein